MSEILVDNLTGKTSAGSIVVYGEGGTATTNLQQGLAKAWISLDGATPAVRDSNNVASVTDNGTGDYTTNFSDSMNNTNYGVSGACCGNGSVNTASNGVQINSSAYNTVSAPTTSAFRSVSIHDVNGVKQDVDYLTLTVNGDLA